MAIGKILIPSIDSEDGRLCYELSLSPEPLREMDLRDYRDSIPEIINRLIYSNYIPIDILGDTHEDKTYAIKYLELDPNSRARLEDFKLRFERREVTRKSATTTAAPKQSTYKSQNNYEKFRRK